MLNSSYDRPTPVVGIPCTGHNIVRNLRNWNIVYCHPTNPNIIKYESERGGRYFVFSNFVVDPPSPPR